MPEPSQLKNLPPDRLVVPTYHRRTVWGDMRSLVASVAEHGVIEPLICRVTKVNGFQVNEIVCGMRRHRAATEAKLPTVPCLFRDMTDDEAIEVQAAENIGREDLHPLDEAEYFALLLERGHDPKTLARKFSRTVREVKDRLRLCALEPSVKQAYASGKLSHYAVGKMAILGAAQQRAVLNAVRTAGLDDDSIAGWIRANLMLPIDDVPWVLDDATAPGGACVTCPKRTGAQRELFADIAAADDLCTDARCWNAKMDHAYQLEVAKATEAGRRVIATDPGTVFLPLVGRRDGVIRSTGYVDAHEEAPLTPNRTWLEAATAAGLTPDPILMRDTTGRPRILLEEKAVAPAIRRMAAATPALPVVADDADETPVARPAAPVEDPARAEVRRRREAAQRREAALVTAVLETDEDTAIGVGAAHLIALVRASVSPATVRAVAKIAKADPDTFGAGARPSAANAIRVALALLAVEMDHTAVDDLERALGLEPR